MLTKDLINHSIPQLQHRDTVAKALQLMNDFRLTHLPVVQENLFAGLISEDDLLDVLDDKTTLQALHLQYIGSAVKASDYFLTALDCCMQFECRVVAVVDEKNEYQGCISSWDLLKTIGEFIGSGHQGSIIALSVDRIHYNVSEICRIIENNDATILHLNTMFHPDTDIMTVTIQINKSEVHSIVSTFERFEYNVIYNHGPENRESEVESNYKHLMNYLNI